MEKVFEDAFMDIQSKMLSLCLELAEGTKIDAIYYYASIEDNSRSANAFYQSGKQLLTLTQVAGNLDLVRQFFMFCSQDLNSLVQACQSYNMPIPTEMKLIYHVDSRHFTSHYQYDPVCTPESGLSPQSVFVNWRESVKAELLKGN